VKGELGILELWKRCGGGGGSGRQGARLAGADWLPSAREENKIPKFPFLLESQTNE
jgi:hypothetical protein